MTLEEHFNTYEKASELIDGGNMGSCYSDNEYNPETGEYETTEPRATYYGGDEEAPILSKNFDEFTRIDCWQEYAYVFVKDRCCLLYTSPSPRDRYGSRMPSSA